MEQPATFDRDADGFVDELVASLGMAARIYEFSHNGVGRLVSALLPDASTLGLGWDEEGRLVPVTPSGQSAHTMSYDPVGRLDEYDPREAFMGTDETTYEYDDDHRLVQVTRPDTETIDIEYDVSTGRVDEVSTSEGAVITPTCDASGRIENLTDPYAAASTELDFTYNGSVLTSEEWSGDTAGIVSLGLDSIGRISSQSINAGSTVSISYRGSVRAVVDDEGNLVQTIEYSPWGEVFLEWSSGFESSFGFAGGLWDPDVKLVRFGARLYDPLTGRWVMKDPILFDGGQANLYGAAAMDNLINPTAEGFMFPTNTLDNWANEMADR